MGLAAPLLALAVTLWRARVETEPAVRWGWTCVAASLGVWSLGQAGNLWWEWGLGQHALPHRAILLLFQLWAVPLLLLLALLDTVCGRWRATGKEWWRATGKE